MTRGMMVLAAGLFGLASLQERPPRRLQLPDGQLTDVFQNILTVRELSDRRLIVGDAGRLMVADLRSGTLSIIGRRGQGPGEYGALKELLHARADTTIMPEASRRRWLVLDGARVVGTWSDVAGGADTALIRTVGRFYFSGILGVDSNLTVLVTGDPQARSTSYEVGPADSLPLLTIARSDARIDTVGMVRMQPLRRVFTPGSAPGEQFSYTVNIAWSRGETSALCRDGWISVVRIDPYRVDWRAPNGAWVRGAPIRHERVRVTEREKQAYTKRFVARSANMSQLPALLNQQLEWPAEIPPVSPIAPICVPDGRILIGRSFTADRRYPLFDVVDRRGAVVEQLALAENDRIVGFGARSVYVVSKDSLDVEILRRHPLPWR